MATAPPIVHIIDDDDSFRTAIGRVLRVSGYDVLLHNSAEAFIKDLPAEKRGCILLDLKMPVLDGFEFQNRLHEMGYILPIVFLSGHGSIPATVRAIKGGAEDFLSKPVSKDALIAAIERAFARFDQASIEAARLNADKALVDRLTLREKEVFVLLVRGKLHKQIAFELQAAERTIKAHRHNIMAKLNVRSLVEAAAIAERVGISKGKCCS